MVSWRMIDIRRGRKNHSSIVAIHLIKQKKEMEKKRREDKEKRKVGLVK